MAEVRAHADVAAGAATAHKPRTVVMAGAGVAALTATATLTVGAAVQAVAEAINPGAVTDADLRALVEQVNVALQAQATVATSPSLALYLRQNAINLLSLLVTIVGVVIAYYGVRQDRAEYARTDSPPNVTVVVPSPDPAEVDRLVDERLRERGLLEETPGEPAG